MIALAQADILAHSLCTRIRWHVILEYIVGFDVDPKNARIPVRGRLFLAEPFRCHEAILTSCRSPGNRTERATHPCQLDTVR